jgi:hypothetical protein
MLNPRCDQVARNPARSNRKVAERNRLDTVVVDDAQGGPLIPGGKKVEPVGGPVERVEGSASNEACAASGSP